jgi:hypothetical protein
MASARPKHKYLNVIRTDKFNKLDLRTSIDGLGLLSQLQKHLRALDNIDEELQNSIQDFSRDILDAGGEILRTEQYRSTVLDKETIAVYHTRQAGRKVQIDTVLRLLNKIMPDLKALEQTGDIGSIADRALLAFAEAAKQ